MTVRQLVITGVSPSDPELCSIAADLELELLPAEAFADVRAKIEALPPAAFVVDAASEAGAQLCLQVRMSALLADSPVIAVVRDPWSSELGAVFAAGVDDYVPGQGLKQLRRKLMAVRKEGAPGGAFLSGQVVLADPDRERRVHLARHLRKMGLNVQFAIDGTDLPSDVGVKLIVANHALPPDDAVACLRRFRGGPGAKIPWVIVGAQPELEAARAALQEQTALSFLDVASDPAQIAFTANQLLIGASRSLRRSPRLKYETALRFEALDGKHEEWGYTYNINRGGLFVRTLTSPALGLDLRFHVAPPYSKERISIEGRVVWRQEYSGSKGYPAGFGVQWAEVMPAPAAAALEAGYNQLLAEAGNPEEC